MWLTLPLLFDISGGELIIVLLFVLMFFGSKGIPDIARTLGRTMRQVRDASNEVQREIHKGAHEVRRSFEEQQKPVHRKGPEVDPDAAGKETPQGGPTAP